MDKDTGEKFLRSVSMDGPKAKTALPNLAAEVQQLLDVMTQEEADAIIGEAGDEYKLVGGAMRAIYGLLWATMRRFGLRHNKRSLKLMSQSMILMAVIVHLTYAMGIRRGRGTESSVEDGKG